MNPENQPGNTKGMHCLGFDLEDAVRTCSQKWSVPSWKRHGCFNELQTGSAFTLPNILMHFFKLIPNHSGALIQPAGIT